MSLFYRSKSKSSPRRPVRLELEALEDRMLLSRSGLEFNVNTKHVNDQYQSANASSQNGRSVVVWTDRWSSNDTDIRAQIYDDAGNKVGNEIIVAFTTRNEHQPAVAMNRQGDFMVVWTEDQPSLDKNVLAARYRADGTKLGTLTVAASSKKEYQPSVAMAGDGHAVVSYTLDWSSTDQDVSAKVYFFADGFFVRSMLVANSTLNEHSSSAAAAGMTDVRYDNYGRFVIAYQKGEDVFLKRGRMDSSNLSLFAVGTSRRLERNPSVAMDYWGNAVVAYEVHAGRTSGTGWDIMARRIDDYGAMGPEITVANTPNHERLPAIGMNPVNGKFVVAYEVGFASGTSQLWVAEASHTGMVTAAYSLYFHRSWTKPAVSVSGRHRYLVTYTSGYENANYGTDIYGQWGQL